MRGLAVRWEAPKAPVGTVPCCLATWPNRGGAFAGTMATCSVLVRTGTRCGGLRERLGPSGGRK